jgi:hypothetical protein
MRVNMVGGRYRCNPRVAPADTVARGCAEAKPGSSRIALHAIRAANDRSTRGCQNSASVARHHERLPRGHPPHISHFPLACRSCIAASGYRQNSLYFSKGYTCHLHATTNLERTPEALHGLLKVNEVNRWYDERIGGIPRGAPLVSAPDSVPALAAGAPDTLADAGSCRGDNKKAKPARAQRSR